MAESRGAAPRRGGNPAEGLRGRVALVTGGGGNLGRHVVRRFLEGGAHLHVPTRDQEESVRLLDALGADAERVHVTPGVDLSDSGAVEALVVAVREIEGSGPEILLNLAGGFAMSPVEDTSPAVWEKMWKINATTAFFTSRAVFPHMREAGWGRIVNVSAFPAVDRGAAGLSAYAAAKSAVLSLTQTLAREGVERGITVNAVLPSIIDTPGNRSAMPDADTSAWLPPQEIAEVLAFLASDRARIVTGAALTLTLSP